MKPTQDTWTRLVSEEQDIPESFGDFFRKIYTVEKPYPYTVFVPFDKWYQGKTNPKLICLFDNQIFIAEKIKEQIVFYCFMIHQIHYIEMGTLLLHSWLKIIGTVDGQLTSTTIEFNTVAAELFKPIIEKIRATIYNLEKIDNSKFQLLKEQQKFDFLTNENFKYMNFGKQSLLPGTEVVQILLQPDIRVKYWKFLYRMISFTQLTILTDQEMIIIKDDDSLKKVQQVRYGGIWCYIPLNKIIKLDVTSNLKGDLYTLLVYLPRDITISTLFSVEQKSQLDLLRSNFEYVSRGNKTEHIGSAG